MNSAHVPEPSLDEWASRTVGLGRELSEMAHEIYAGGNSRDFGLVARTLQRLGDRHAFDDRDSSSLKAIRDILETDLNTEIVGTKRVFVETLVDEEGCQGEVMDIPVYSARGAQLAQILRMLSEFEAARAATLDRLAAERALLRLMSA